jgi:hypothetical protein
MIITWKSESFIMGSYTTKCSYLENEAESIHDVYELFYLEWSSEHADNVCRFHNGIPCIVDFMFKNQEFKYQLEKFKKKSSELMSSNFQIKIFNILILHKTSDNTKWYLRESKISKSWIGRSLK